MSGGANVASVAGSGAGFTGVSSRIEIVGLHYEVTPQDLKVRFQRLQDDCSQLTITQTIFSQAGTLVQGPNIRVSV